VMTNPSNTVVSIKFQKENGAALPCSPAAVESRDRSAE
jgi:hypothetical protein